MVFVVRRVAELVLVLVVVSFLGFILVHVTGDPAIQILGPEASSEALDELRQEMGLNDPWLVQYGRFLGKAIQGDLGTSTRFREPALALYMERLPATLELALGALIYSVITGGILGILAAVYKGSKIDLVVRFSALIGQAIPGFYLGLVAIIIFGVHLNWLPTGGRGTLAHLVLPAVTLGSLYSATIARFIRGVMLEVLEMDYIRTARSKGLSNRIVIFRHALRNALIPVITLLGLQAGSMMGHAVVTETVFSWPGIGRMAVQGIYSRDFPLVQVTITMSAAIFVLINLITDLVYAAVDPRVRFGDG